MHRNKTGFTLLEVAISVGLLAIVSIGVVSFVSSLMQNKAEIINATDADSFVGALAKWLQSPSGCGSTLTSMTLGATPAPLVITAYNGFGSRTGPIQANFSVNSSLIIKSITVQDKSPSSPGVIIPINGINYTKKIAQIMINFESQVGQSKRELHQRVIELPVLLDGGGVIQQCHFSADIAESCSVMGGTYSNGLCTPATFCHITGAYSVVSCNPSDPACPTSSPNPVTGGQSCPALSTAIQTGQFTDTQTISTNKGKGTTSITVTAVYYVCQQCSSLGNPCAATTISNCDVSAVQNGGTSGTCSAGFTGLCNYGCVNGNWVLQQGNNSCQ